MQLEEVNLYIDPLMAVAFKRPDRSLLVELAEESEGLEDLLRNWLWEQDRGSDAALEIKNLFQLRYDDLGRIFSLNFKEVTQLLRTQRAESIGAYVKREDSHAGGISCFLVDQLLSPWVDSEWDNLLGLDQVGRHLEICTSCSRRLHEYRELNAKILAKRMAVPLLFEDEWVRTLKRLRRVARKRHLKVFSAILLILAAIVALWILVAQRPEKTLNVYEITEPTP